VPNPLEITLSSQISNAAAQTTLSLEEAITNMKVSGMADSAIRQSLLSDLNSGGPIFGSFRNKVKNTVRNGVEFSSNQSSKGVFVKAGVERFQWVTVGDGKVCPDCDERHGETGTMEFFELLGLPGSGFSVCGPNCRCKVIPANYKGENLDKPLIKQKININAANMAGKHKTIKDAEKWALLNIKGVRKTNYKKMDIDNVNTINKELGLLQKKYNRLGNIEEIEIVSNVRFAGRMERGRKLQIRSDQTNELWKRSVEAGIDIGKPHLGGLIDHEIGHALTPPIFEQIGNKMEFTKFGRRLNSFFNINKPRIKKEISEYAASKRHEFVAEAFAMREAKKAPQWVIDWLESEGI
tara:strand:- start:198 stop:1253 length:1056 start_codon:yes stop_codon:yes gene_type:complete